MISTISQKTDAYYSLGQYLERNGAKVTPTVSILIDKFIVDCPADELENAINMMSSNVHGAVADRKNGRIDRAISSVARDREAKMFDQYNSYVMNMSTQKVSPGVIPSICVKTTGNVNYTIYIEPDTELLYEVAGKRMSYSDVLLHFFGMSCNASIEFNVPTVSPVNLVSSQIAQKNTNDVVLGVAEIENSDVEQAKVVLNCLKQCILNDSEKKLSKLNTLVKDAPVLSLSKSGHNVNIPLDSSIHHNAMDKHGVLSNGQISKAYYTDIGLDNKIKSAEKEELFFEALSIDYNSKNLDPNVLKKYEYIFYNSGWIKYVLEERQDLIPTLSRYWFAVIPGSSDLVLRRSRGVVPLWQDYRRVKPCVNMLKKVHTYYSLLRMVKVIPLEIFIGTFCDKNEISNMKRYLLFSLELYKRPVAVKVKVTHKNEKHTERIFDISSMLMRGVVKDLDVDDLVEFPSSVDNFFGDDVIDEGSVASYNNVGELDPVKRNLKYVSPPLSESISIVSKSSSSPFQSVNDKSNVNDHLSVQVVEKDISGSRMHIPEKFIPHIVANTQVPINVSSRDNSVPYQDGVHDYAPKDSGVKDIAPDYRTSKPVDDPRYASSSSTNSFKKENFLPPRDNGGTEEESPWSSSWGGDFDF